MSNGADNPLKSADDVRVFCQVHRAEYAANLHHQEGWNEKMEIRVQNLEIRQRKTENRGAKMGGVYLAAGAAIAVALQVAAFVFEN